ncbi:unnamed protein product [Closterium sp. Naga37s-1]|nr:unnamed protein product [Closterium sp. Naga37s-1]
MGGRCRGAGGTGSAPMGGFAGGMGGALSSWGARRAGINPPRLQVEVHAEEEEGEGEGEEGNVYVVDEEEDEGEEGGSKDALSPLPGAEGRTTKSPAHSGEEQIASQVPDSRSGADLKARAAQPRGWRHGGNRRQPQAQARNFGGFQPGAGVHRGFPRGGPAEGAEPEEGDLSLSLSPPHALYASGGADPVFDAMSPRLLTPKGFSTGFGAAAGPGPAGSGLLGGWGAGVGGPILPPRSPLTMGGGGSGAWGDNFNIGEFTPSALQSPKPPRSPFHNEFSQDRAAAAAAASAAGSAAAAAGAGQLPLTPGRNRALVAARGGGGGGGALMRGSARERPSPEMDEEDDVWGAAAAVTGGAGGAGGGRGGGLGGGGGGKDAERSGSGAGMGAGRGGMGRMGATATAAAAAGAHAAGGARSSGGALAAAAGGEYTASGPSGRLRAAAWGRMRADGGRRDERAAGVGGWEGGDGEGGEEGEGGEREPQQQQWQRRQGRGQAAGGAGGGGGVGGWGGDIIGSSSSSSDAIATNPASSAAANASTGGGGGSSSSGDSGTGARRAEGGRGAEGRQRGGGRGGKGQAGGEGMREGGGGGVGDGMRVERRNTVDPHAEQFLKSLSQYISRGLTGELGPYGGEGEGEKGDAEADMWQAQGEEPESVHQQGAYWGAGPYGGEGEGEKGDAEADMWQAQGEDPESGHQPGLTGELGPYGGEGEGEKGDAEADMWQVMSSGSMRWRDFILRMPYDDVKKFYSVSATKIGSGRYGVIRTCLSRKTRVVLACKTIRKDQVKCMEDAEDVRTEVIILGMLRNHPGIISLHDAFEDAKYVHLIMEMCRGGDLFDRVKLRGQFKETDAAIVCRSLVEALLHCHSNGVIHRDVKPENVLMCDKDVDTKIKLIDFGVATFYKRGVPCTERAGTVEYTAPEVLDKSYGPECDIWSAGTVEYTAPEVLDKSYGPECDIWSAGVVLYILLCGFPPFWAATNAELEQSVRAAAVDFRHPRWAAVSDGAKDLVKRMLTKDVRRRISALEIFGGSGGEGCGLVVCERVVV